MVALRTEVAEATAGFRDELEICQALQRLLLAPDDSGAGLEPEAKNAM